MSGGNCKSSPHFFKILLGDFLERLRIPPAFVEHNVIDPSERAQIKGPSGSIWYVQLSVRGKDIYLQDGWKKFVEDHSLKDSNFLLFGYEGNGLFTVQIFDKTGCNIEEIITCNTSKKSILISGEKKGGSPETTLADDFEQHSQHKLHGSDMKNPQKDSLHSLQTSQSNKTDSTQRQHMPTFKINQFKKIKTDGVELTMSKTCSYSKGNQRISKKQSSAEEKTKAFDNANAFSRSSKLPNFLKIMRRSGVTRGMLGIPTYFMRKYLPKRNTSISLIDPTGRPWEVNFVRHLCKRGGSFSGGWPAFSHGNNLREEDVCMFELVGECRMRVHIFRSEMPPPTPVKSSEKTKPLKRASHF